MTIADMATPTLHVAEETGSLICNVPPAALNPVILQGVAHLRGVPGIPQAAAGPSICYRVSCSQSDGIWWCNDVSLNTFPSLPSVCLW